MSIFGIAFGRKPTNDTVHLFNAAAAGHDEIHGLHVDFAQSWKKAFLWTVPTLIILCIVITVGYQSTMNVIVRSGGNHIFEVPVNDKGVVVGKPSELYVNSPNPTDDEVQSRLAQVIDNAYSVSPDPRRTKDNFDFVYTYFQGGAVKEFNDYLSYKSGMYSPYVLGHTYTAAIKVTDMRHIGNTYNVTWLEDYRLIDGTPSQVKKCEATFTVGTIAGALTSDQILRDPFRIAFTDIQPSVGGDLDQDDCGLNPQRAQATQATAPAGH